jgi:hypothetical protein
MSLREWRGYSVLSTWRDRQVYDAKPSGTLGVKTLDNFTCDGTSDKIIQAAAAAREDWYRRFGSGGEDDVA